MAKKKKQLGKRALAFSVLPCLFLLLFSQAAYAVGDDEIELTVWQSFTNHTGDAVNSSFVYELTVQGPAAPLPAGSSGDSYTFSLSGGSAAQTIRIQYPAAGTFHYTLRQLVAAPEQGYTYDAREYAVEVNALPGENGINAYAVVKNGEGEKVDAIAFASSFAVAVQPPKTFTKQVQNPATGRYTGSIAVSDPRSDIQYRVRARLGSLQGYSSIELADTLDARLNYKTARVYLAGRDITEEGSLSFDRADNTLRYTFSTPLDTEALQNQTVELHLTVTVKPDIADFTDIRNQASLVVNGNTPFATENDTRLALEYGHIQGYVFVDANNNGLRDDASPAYLNGMRVTLEGWDGDAWHLVQVTTAGADGAYQFKDISGHLLPQPFGRYRVGIQDRDGLFTYTERNRDSTPYSGQGSDANPSTGFAEVELSAGLRQPMVNIGLVPLDPASEPAPDEPSYVKVPSVQYAQPGDTVRYSLSGFGNTTGKTSYEFGVTDVVPDGLTFTGGSFPAFAGGQGVSYSIEYITNYNSSYRVMHGNASAGAPLAFGAPPLQAGERVTMVTMMADSVPAGFGVGDTLTFTFQVEEDAPETVVNTALFGEGLLNTGVEAQGIAVNESGQTPQEQDAAEGVADTYSLENDTNAETPLSGFLLQQNTTWSLCNVLLVLLGLAAFVLLGIRAVYRTGTGKARLNYLALAAGILLWAASAILGLLTSRWDGEMVLANQATGTIALLTALSALVLWFSARKIHGQELTGITEGE